MKWGPFGLSLPWGNLALGGFRIVSKKWIDQSEDRLWGKTVTAIVGLFPLKEMRLLTIMPFISQTRSDH